MSESAGTKGERTRARILDAARRVFGSVGYDRATIRAIAAEAGADKSSVIQYFGTKPQLFTEAVTYSMDFESLTVGSPAESAEHYLRAMLERWASDPATPMSVLLRASLTSEEATALMRRHVTAEAVDRMAPRLEGPDARLRASLAAAFMFGITLQRHLLRVPDLAEADVEDVLRVAGPQLRSLLGPPPGVEPEDSGAS